MKRKRFVDPRTKLFLLLTLNIVLLSLGTGEGLDQLRLAAGLLPFFLLLYGGLVRIALTFLILYLGANAVGAWVLPVENSVLALFLGFFYSMGTRFLPGGMMGVYFIGTTKVNEFILAMEKMHVPNKVTIPISVLFRFFPTVKEEASAISDAMRMRNLGFGYFWNRPVEILEYRMVPMMMSTVTIGEDLSASALTRCLGMYSPRSSISDGGFGKVDALLFALCFALIGLYFYLAGGGSL